MKLYHIIYIFLFVVISSCNQEDEVIEQHQNLGNYKLLSLSSDVDLDLNYDGLKSKDFQHELSFYFERNGKASYDMKLLQHSHLPLNEMDFYLDIPKDNYLPDQTLISIRYGFANHSKTAFIKNDTVYKIEHVLSNRSFQDSIWFVDIDKNPYPYKIKFVNDSTTEIKVVQKFFDLETQEWVTTNLVGVYEKK